jgi:hypothetical protein
LDLEVIDAQLGSWFHDQSRFRSAEVARAFSSALREISMGTPQSEVAQPHEVTLIDSGCDASGAAIVRGAD